MKQSLTLDCACIQYAWACLPLGDSPTRSSGQTHLKDPTLYWAAGTDGFGETFQSKLQVALT
jgi:hypothetical protein